MPRSLKHSNHRRSGKAGRSSRDEEHDENNHWLGEGLSGQDTLLLDLDPYQYIGDQAVCHIIRNWIFEHQREREKPKALLVVGGEQVGYQMGFLAEHFDVFVWADETNELCEAACATFHAELVLGPLPMALQGNLDLILLAGHTFKNRQSFTANIRQAEEALSERGLLVALVPGRLQAGRMSIRMLEDDLEVDALLEGEVFLVPAPSFAEQIPFDFLPNDEEGYMREFLKRHVSFFGKGAAGPMLKYLQEPDFAAALFGEDARLRYSLVLAWENGGKA